MKKLLSVLLMVLLVLGCIMPANAMVKSDNPMIDPNEVPEYVQTQDEYLNVLLLGIDHGAEIKGSGDGAKRADVAKCHTDAVMLASVNLTQNKLNLISIPRDVLVYVPGVHGVYKLNAAYNCADSIEEGLLRTCETVSWLLGNIKIDKYVALDFDALIALGDAMGGIDYYMDVNFKNYTVGQTHLNGKQMLDYFRVRKNVSEGANDMGRTGRGRKMITAILQKLYSQPTLVAKLWDTAFNGKSNFFTNLAAEDYVYLYQLFCGLNFEDVGSYMLSGKYGLTGLSDWYFNILDQDVRLDIIREVFGIEAEELKYVSMEYTKWLAENGFPAANRILTGKKILEYGLSQENLTDAQKQAVQEFEEAYDAAVMAFDAASQSMKDDEINAMMTKALTNMINKGKEAAKRLDYMKDTEWSNGILWFRNPTITQYSEIDWQ